MNFFIAGIMQGSRVEESLHAQNYRDEIKAALERAFPGAEVYDPFAANKNSLFYSDETGKNVFLNHNRMCATKIDVLVAFAPEASMGTAIEIWEAWKNGAVVLTISPLAKNWVVKFLSDVVYPDFERFVAALETGDVARAIAARPPRRTTRTAEIDAAVRSIEGAAAAEAPR